MPTYHVLVPVFPVQALGCQTTHSNQEVLQSCSLVFFATKPHVLPAVLAEVAPVVTAEHILVSVAAGLPLSSLEEVSAHGEEGRWGCDPRPAPAWAQHGWDRWQPACRMASG